jgi:hydroxyethylthiazole kinase-like uncharacterized protein yjeF
MERAAFACTRWLMENRPLSRSYAIYCGKGNNGGDGLAIARMFISNHYKVSLYIVESGQLGTQDFQTNLARLHSIPGIDIHFIQEEQELPAVLPGAIIIDALYGSGLNRPLKGITASLVEQLNHSGNERVSIDLPSGLYADRSSKDALTIHADHTLTFQSWKKAFLFAENSFATGRIHLLDIGLDEEFPESLDITDEMVDASIAKALYKPRNNFSHKGNFGHALLLAGSYGKIGAAVLCAKACLRSGVGLLTVQAPSISYSIIQSSVPEAMLLTDFNSSILTALAESPNKYEAVGIGPGIGTARETGSMLATLLEEYRKPIVIDADALNLISLNKELLSRIPPDSILTPHPKEFDRLFGETANDFDRAALATAKAMELGVIIILKGHHTLIATPGGKAWYNNTGNAGMATGGSGDVLTGILTGLLAQGYDPVAAAIFGVYLHGLAGDLAAHELSMEAMIASDVTDHLGAAFRTLH